MLAARNVPTVTTLLWPTLQAVKGLGGSATIAEIETKVTELIGASEEIQAIPHGRGRYSELGFRTAWARSVLKGAGLLETNGRGVWSVTEAGRARTEHQMGSVRSEYRAARKARSKATGADVGDDAAGEGEENESPADDPSDDWRGLLLERLLQLSPDQFERLAKRILREAGFTRVEVTGQSGDGGIDGTGIYRQSLISFPMFFQCKRYRGTVSSPKVRDFRGAMAGRGDKGLLITTGTFTADAKRESTRPGAPIIDLVDGEGLCQLLFDYGLGVSERRAVVVDSEFFDQL